MAESPKITPESAAQDFIASARKYSSFGSPSSWTLIRTVKVLRSLPPVFSLECSEYSYTGGVHGTSGAHYLNLDPLTGDPVKLASILKNGATARLNAIAEVHFRKARKLTATEKLENAGFGGFELNDNYGFSEKALLFFFNDYELGAAHGMGTTLVEIPYAEIRGLIRPGFPL
jgi:hypothetical protein